MIKSKRQQQSELERRINKTIRKIIELPRRRIDPRTTVYDLAGQDWHRAINLTFDFESAFGVEFDDEEFREIQLGAVGALVKILSNKVENIT
jgi:acyl carrier protein